MQFYHGVRAVRPAVYAVLFLEHRSVFCLGGGDRREDISIVSVKENEREEEEFYERGGRSSSTTRREHYFNSRFSIALKFVVVVCARSNSALLRELWIVWSLI